LPYQSTPSHNTTRPLTSSAAAAPETFLALKATNTTDSEPDEEIPAISGGKGLRVNKIMVLKQGGGLLNYWTWLQEAHNAFLADPYCFNTVEKHVIFAALNIDNNM
jgi:hypothetical protein